MSAAETVADGAEEAVENVKGFLGKKIGPLPAGAWILAVAGGIAVAVFVRRGANQDIAADDYAQGAADAAGEAGWDQPDPGGAFPGVGGNGPSDFDDEDRELPDSQQPGAGGPVKPQHGHAWRAKHAKTNADWRRHAVLAMGSRGYRTGVVNGALGDYLNRRRLTAAQAAIVGATLAACGAPPKPPKHKANPGGGHGQSDGHGQSSGHADTKDRGTGHPNPHHTGGPRWPIGGPHPHTPDPPKHSPPLGTNPHNK